MTRIEFVYNNGEVRDSFIDFSNRDTIMFDVSFDNNGGRLLLSNCDLKNLFLRNLFVDSDGEVKLSIYQEEIKVLSVTLTNVKYKISNISPSNNLYELIEAGVVDVANN